MQTKIGGKKMEKEKKNWDFEINLNECKIEKDDEKKSRFLKCRITEPENQNS